MTKRISFILLFSLIGWIALIAVVSAAECTQEFCPLADIEGTKLQGLYDSSGKGDLSTFISRIFAFAITAGALMAVLRLTYAGYLYMVTDLWSTKGKAVEMIQTTTLGLFLLLAVYLILYQINPQILSLQILFKSSGNNAQTLEDRATRAGLDLMGEHIDDKTTDPREYTRSVGPSPLPEHYCYPSKVAPGNYACLTNEANCRELARTEDATCTFYTESGSDATQDNTGNTINSQQENAGNINQSSGQEGAFYTAGNVPVGLWCYQNADGYGCFQSQNECTSGTQGASITAGCKRVLDGG